MEFSSPVPAGQVGSQPGAHSGHLSVQKLVSTRWSAGPRWPLRVSQEALKHSAFEVACLHRGGTWGQPGGPHLGKSLLAGQVDCSLRGCPDSYCHAGPQGGDRDQAEVWGTGRPYLPVGLMLLPAGQLAAWQYWVEPGGHRDTRCEVGPQAGQVLAPLTLQICTGGRSLALVPWPLSVSQDPHPATQRALAGAAQSWATRRAD